MNKKLFAEIALISITFLLVFIFFFKYFQKKNEKISVNQDQDILLEKENLIKDDDKGVIVGIKYVSTDVNGNTYDIKAETGQIDQENQELIKLFNVEANLIFDNTNRVNVRSDSAIYNNNNFDTVFTNNVILNYKDHNIKCEKMIAQFSENIAILSDNLIYNNLQNKLYADKMIIDLISRDTEITMFDKENKIKIIHKKNGSN